MLVLSRRVTESIDIGEGIHIRVLEVRGSRVRLAIEAPREVPIRRSELPRFDDVHLATNEHAQGAPAQAEVRDLSLIVADAVL